MKQAIISSVAVASLLLAAEPVNKDARSIAIKGYDPIAYFTQSKPVRGSAGLSFMWMGATWLFASAEDRDLFAHSPEKFAPQYGGYCAYGVSQGRLVSIDPEAWTIVDGKLYLNYSKGIQRTWSQAPERYIMDANRLWPTLR